MKKVYKCDFCEKTFSTESGAVEYEKKCSKNPQNKITDCTITRLAMILHHLYEIIGAAISDIRENDIAFLLEETERADDCNCPFTVKEKQNMILYLLRGCRDIKSKRIGLNTTKYDDIIKDYPELYLAFKATLERKAYNEW